MKKYILIITFLTVAAPFAHADITTGLVGWWKFNEGSGTTAIDSSGNGFNGTLIGGPTYVTGKIGAYALSLDGINDTIMANTTYATLDSHTMCMWIRPNFGDTDTSNQKIFDRQQTPGDNNRIANISWNGSGNQWYTDSRAAWAYSTADSQTPFSSGQWHHICFDYTAGVSGGPTGKFYWDGTLKTTSNLIWLTDPYDTSNMPIYIGSALNEGEYFNSYVDDVRLYNRPLSGADVEELYNYAEPSPDNAVHGFLKIINRRLKVVGKMLKIW
jgi:concanavalin A-like lectin/glucanase superfamily protein